MRNRDTCALREEVETPELARIRGLRVPKLHWPLLGLDNPPPHPRREQGSLSSTPLSAAACTGLCSLPREPTCHSQSPTGSMDNRG